MWVAVKPRFKSCGENRSWAKNCTGMAVTDCWCNTLPALIGFGAGVVSGSYGNHRPLSRSLREQQNREHADKAAKEARRRNFISFLDGLKAEAIANYRNSYRQSFRTEFMKSRREASKIRGDIDLDNKLNLPSASTSCAISRTTTSRNYLNGTVGDYVGRRALPMRLTRLRTLLSGEKLKTNRTILLFAGWQMIL